MKRLVAFVINAPSNHIILYMATSWFGSITDNHSTSYVNLNRIKCSSGLFFGPCNAIPWSAVWFRGAQNNIVFYSAWAFMNEWSLHVDNMYIALNIEPNVLGKGNHKHYSCLSIYAEHNSNESQAHVVLVRQPSSPFCLVAAAAIVHLKNSSQQSICVEMSANNGKSIRRSTVRCRPACQPAKWYHNIMALFSSTAARAESFGPPSAQPAAGE